MLLTYGIFVDIGLGNGESCERSTLWLPIEISDIY